MPRTMAIAAEPDYTRGHCVVALLTYGLAHAQGRRRHVLDRCPARYSPTAVELLQL